MSVGRGGSNGSEPISSPDGDIGNTWDSSNRNGTLAESFVGMVGGIGEATVVAGILGATVDPFLKSKLTEDMFGNVLQAIYGTGLPLAVQTEMKRIAASKIVRHDFEADFRFYEVDLAKHEIHVETSISFTAENVSNESQTFIHTMWVHDGIGSQILSAQCAGSTSGDYELNATQIQAKLDDEGGCTWSEQVTIAPRGRARFWGQTARVLPLAWEDVFYFSHPTVGAKVRVSAPRDVAVQVAYIHEDGPRTKCYHTQNWELLDAAFLPNMSFLIKWKPSRRTSTRHAG